MFFLFARLLQFCAILGHGQHLPQVLVLSQLRWLVIPKENLICFVVPFHQIHKNESLVERPKKRVSMRALMPSPLPKSVCPTQSMVVTTFQQKVIGWMKSMRQCMVDVVPAIDSKTGFFRTN